jgi:carboxylesterase type B
VGRSRRFVARIITVVLVATIGAAVSAYSAQSGGGSGRSPRCNAVPRQTQSGEVCGLIQRSDGYSASAYLGVPYAAPPVGALRWVAPRPPNKWRGVRRATQYASLCTQPYGSPTFTGFKGSEDCLYLNIWTPVRPSASPRAVLVYIPGGGYLVGGGSLTPYSGAHIAARSDLDVVTINYRLGALGFLRYLGQGSSIQGNFGTLDQDAALEWVHRNIAHFGGDPSKVTLWGESAGAISTALHLFSIPRDHDMFRAAIMDSNVNGALLPTPSQAAQSGALFVNLLCQYQTTSGCPQTESWLRSRPLSTIMTAENSQLSPQGIHGLFLNTSPIAFEPIVGVAPITGQPLTGYQPNVAPKPFVMGHNKDEGGFFTPQPQWMTNAQYRAWLTAAFTSTGATAIQGYTVNGAKPYSAASYSYSAGAQMTPAAQAYMRVVTDGLVVSPNIMLTQNVQQKMATARLPMFGFTFNEVASFNYQGLPQCSPASRNVCHSYELPFVFNNLVQLEGSNTENSYVAVQATPQEERLAKTMAGAWAGFAKNPTAAGWGYRAIGTNPAAGPYIQFGQTIGPVNNVATNANFSLWQPILAAELANAGR